MILSLFVFFVLLWSWYIRILTPRICLIPLLACGNLVRRGCRAVFTFVVSYSNKKKILLPWTTYSWALFALFLGASLMIEPIKRSCGTNMMLESQTMISFLIPKRLTPVVYFLNLSYIHILFCCYLDGCKERLSVSLKGWPRFNIYILLPLTSFWYWSMQ